MIKKVGVFVVVVCVWLPLLISCATTRQVRVWKDDTYQGKIKKVLVIGVSLIPEIRGFFENEFVDQLKSRGVEGVASNKIISSEQMRDKEAVLAAVKGTGIETILVTRLVDQGYVDSFYGGGVELVPTDYYGGWNGIWGQGFAAVPLPTYQHSERIVILQTNVYDLQREKLVFSAISKTYIEGAKELVVKPFINSMVEELVGDKLL